MTRKRLHRHQHPWSPSDLQRLRALARRRLPATAAAPRLGRTVGAVKYKAMTAGISFRAINQPPGTQRTAKQRATLSRLAARRHRLARAARGAAL